jgi:hypothetical protein
MIHLVKLVGARDAAASQVVFLVNAFKGYFSSSVKVPKRSVKVKE